MAGGCCANRAGDLQRGGGAHVPAALRMVVEPHGRRQRVQRRSARNAPVRRRLHVRRYRAPGLVLLRRADDRRADVSRRGASVRQRPDDGRAVPPPGEPATIASLDIAFTAQNEATFTFTEATPSASLRKQVKANRTKKKSLQPQLPKPGTFVFPAAYDVYFQLNGKASISGVTSAIALASAGISVSKVGTGSEIQFYAQRIGTNPSFVLDYEYRAQGCTFVSTRTLDGVPFELTITSYARYTLHFLVPPGTVPGQLKCPDSNDPVVLPFPGFDVTFSGVVQGRDRDGARCAGCIYSNTTGQPAPGVTYDYYYNLTPKP